RRRGVAAPFKARPTNYSNRGPGTRGTALNPPGLKKPPPPSGPAPFSAPPPNWGLRGFSGGSGLVARGCWGGLVRPFWHDLLETLFGLKNRMQAQAQQAASAVIKGD